MKIDSDIPIPASSGAQRGRPRRYPFKEMTRGQSIFLLLDGRTPGYVGNMVLSAARRAGVEAVYQREGNGVRVWVVTPLREG